MGAPGAGDLTVAGPSPLHRAAPHVKLVAALAFVVAVVATPGGPWWPFAVHGAVLVALARLGTVPLRTVVSRLRVEIPFLLLPALLPFVAEGRRVEVLGVSVSEPGLRAAAELALTATLGLATTVLLVSTTPLVELVRGLERLRVPALLCAIAASMVRYLGVISGDLQRMRIARVSRAHDPRWLWQARAVAASLGALFVRTYERGERVHLAMLARGGVGSFAALPAEPAPGRQWLAALAVPAAGASVAMAGALA